MESASLKINIFLHHNLYRPLGTRKDMGSFPIDSLVPFAAFRSDMVLCNPCKKVFKFSSILFQRGRCPNGLKICLTAECNPAHDTNCRSGCFFVVCAIKDVRIFACSNLKGRTLLVSLLVLVYVQLSNPRAYKATEKLAGIAEP